MRRSGGLWRPVQERLFVAGRYRTHVLAELARQVAAVHEALDGLPQLDGGRRAARPGIRRGGPPLLGALDIAGVPVLSPRGTAKLVRRPGPITLEQRTRFGLLEDVPPNRRLMAREALGGVVAAAGRASAARGAC